METMEENSMKKVLTFICAILLALVPMLSVCGAAAAAEDEARKAELQALWQEGYDYYTGTNGKTYDREAALRCFREAAEGGYADAWFYLGWLTRNGTEPDRYEKAMAYFQKAEELGSLLGLYGQAMLYYHGEGVKQDTARAIELCEAAVAAGCADANAGLSEISLMKKDGKAAISYGEKALEGDHPFLISKAMLEIGLVYNYGYDVPKDYVKALEWMKKSAELGNSAACSNVALYYKEGRGVDKDEKEAVAWYEKAAAGGNTEDLAICYYRGMGVERDYQKAMELFLRSLTSGVVNVADDANEAYWYIGSMYRDGLGVKQDYTASLEWFTRGIEAGDPDCCFAAARQYMKGQGTEKDPDRALALCEEATDKSGYACRKLGDMYRDGDLMDKNIEKAIYYYEKGCGKGDRSCFGRMGDVYAEGTGVEPDYQKALEYYEKGAELGSVYCVGNMGWMYTYKLNPPDYEKALVWFEKGAEMEDSYCLDRLGAFYEEGLGVTADPEKAAAYYYRAVDRAGKEGDTERQKWAMEGLIRLKRTAARVAINEKKVSVLVGAAPELARSQLSCTVMPETAMWKDVTWTSSDEKIATVDQNGVVCGVAPGKVTISAAARQPLATAKEARVNVTVGQAVTGIETDSSAITIAVKKSAKVKASVSPENASGKKLAWTSENEEIATVNAGGQITGKSAGTTTVTVKATDGSEVSASIQVTVFQPVSRINIQDKKVVLAPGDTQQLTVQVLPENATDNTILWSSDQETVAAVDASGTVTAVDSGSCNITGTAADGSGVKAKIRVTVK